MLIDCPAPDFKAEACMPDGSFKEVKLSSYKGKPVVLFFYPADFTFVCATEVPGFDRLKPEFDARGIEILGVSTDTVHAHKGWTMLPKAQGGVGAVSYPLVADVTKEISVAYDVLHPNGLAVRGVFLIDKDGYVRAEHKHCDPLGRNVEEWLRLVDAWKFHEESKAKGETMVCPANWKLGKKAVKPTLEGVAAYNNSVEQ